MDYTLFKLIKHTNLDMKDVACLYVVHILQHQTSCPSTKSTEYTIVIASKQHCLPLPLGKYGKLTNHSTSWCHQVNEGNSSLEAEQVRGRRTLRSVWSLKQHVAEKRWEMRVLSNKDKAKWIENYADRETTVARTRVVEAETAINKE